MGPSGPSLLRTAGKTFVGSRRSAESGRFELPVALRATQPFQDCTIGRSDTIPEDVDHRNPSDLILTTEALRISVDSAAEATRRGCSRGSTSEGRGRLEVWPSIRRCYPHQYPQRDSNSRHLGPKPSALSTELWRQIGAVAPMHPSYGAGSFLLTVPAGAAYPDPLERSLRHSATSRTQGDLGPIERSYPLEVSGAGVRQTINSCSHCRSHLANSRHRLPCPRSDSN